LFTAIVFFTLNRFVDYVAARAAVKKELVKGLFGPAKGGVFSASLQVIP
jgi:hypothetical protein